MQIAKFSYFYMLISEQDDFLWHILSQEKDGKDSTYWWCQKTRKIFPAVAVFFKINDLFTISFF